MARINLDNEFWSDPRLAAMTTVHPKHIAVGAIACLWELGQSYWKKNKSLIPSDVFEWLPLSSDLVRFGFAVRSDDGVYVRGANERWGFLLAASENGKKSAEARKAKYGTATPFGASNSSRTESEQTSERNPNKTEPSSSSSFSSSSSLKKRGEENPKNPNARMNGDHHPHPLFWIWNENKAHDQPEALECSGQRLVYARTRWNEKPDPTYWTEIVKKIAASSFCRGDNNRGWKADLDFLVQPETHFRVLEGKYSDRNTKTGKLINPEIEKLHRMLEQEEAAQ